MRDPVAADRMTQSFLAAAGGDLCLDERIPSGYDLSTGEIDIGRIEDPIAGRPALGQTTRGYLPGGGDS